MTCGPESPERRLHPLTSCPRRRASVQASGISFTQPAWTDPGLRRDDVSSQTKNLPLRLGDLLAGILVGENPVLVGFFTVVLAGARIGQHLFDDKPGVGANGALQLRGDLRIFLEI